MGKTKTAKKVDYSSLPAYNSQREYNKYRDKLRKRAERADKWLPGNLRDIGEKYARDTKLPTWSEFQKMKTSQKKAAFAKAAAYENSPLSTDSNYKEFRDKTIKSLAKSAKSGLAKAGKDQKRRYLTKEELQELQRLLGATQSKVRADKNAGLAAKHYSSDQMIELFTQSIGKEGKTAAEARADIEKIIDSTMSRAEKEAALSERLLELKKKKYQPQSNKKKEG